MNTTNILQLANDCEFIRRYIHEVKYHGDMLSDEFAAVARHIAYYQRANSLLIQTYGLDYKARFVARLNQIISRAPRIRFWA